MTISPQADDALRATQLGAIGYIAKPLRFSAIKKCLAPPKESQLQRAARSAMHPIGRAIVIDPETTNPELSCDIRDLSRSGAFLITPGRLEVGTRLDLMLELPTGRARVEAEVVRVQEPAWGHGGGVGIVFRSFAHNARHLIDGFTNQERFPSA